MFQEPGHAYVYLVYGLHHCLNVVTVGPDHPEAVLLRGADVVEGLERVRARRGSSVREGWLADGPGKLCQALAVGREDDGADLCRLDSLLRIHDDGFDTEGCLVRRLPRVGVDYAGEASSWPLRLVTVSSV